jgi:hypothetical protein
MSSNSTNAEFANIVKEAERRYPYKKKNATPEDYHETNRKRNEFIQKRSLGDEEDEGGPWTLVTRKVRTKKQKTDAQLEAETQAYILATEQAFANRNQDMNDEEFNAHLNNIGSKF